MNVRLAAQVLRETVGQVLLVTGSAEVAATANLCLVMDKCFECLNVRNTEEHKIKLQDKSFAKMMQKIILEGKELLVRGKTTPMKKTQDMLTTQ